MKASEFILDTIDSISSWSSVDSNSTLELRTNYLVDTSSSPLTLTIPIASKLGDQIILRDQSNSFSTNNVTLTSTDKITGLTDDFVLDVSGSTTILVYIDSGYGWQVIENRADVISNIEIDESGIDNGFILKYNQALNKFEYKERRPLSIAPVLSGVSSALEMTNVIITITNYDAGGTTYDVSVPAGVFNRVGDVITWTLPDISSPVTYEISVTGTQNGGFIPNTTRHSVYVMQVVVDGDIVYNNEDIEDLPAGWEGKKFVYGLGEDQELADDDFYQARIVTDVVNSEEYEVDGDSTTSNLLLNYPTSGALSNGDTIISGKDSVANLHTVGNVTESTSGSITQYNLSNLTPSLSATYGDLPDNVYVDDNTMYLSKGTTLEDIDANVLDDVHNDVTYDVIGTYPTSGAIAVSDKLLIDGVENVADVVTESQVEVSNEGFGVVTYTGDGTTNHEITGLGFQPDLVWIKNRNVAYSHFISDSVNGVSYFLNSDTTFAQFYSTIPFKSYDNDGFTIGNYPEINGSGNSIVAWCWKADKHGYDNNDYGLSQEEKYSLDSGLSIISYTGNNTTGRKVKHSLGVKPKMVIVKCLTTATEWVVYHDEIGATKYLLLNTTNTSATSSAIWNDTEPTDEYITLASNIANNSLNNEYIAYVFSDIDDVSNFGSYTGTGVVGNVVNIGFEPAYVMIKRTDSTGDWNVYDNKRDTTNPNNQILNANTTNAESTDSARQIDITTTGFIIQGLGATTNASGGNYIYMAFADSKEVTKYLIDTDTEVTDEPTTCASIPKYDSVDLASVSNHATVTEASIQSTVWDTLFINGQTLDDQNGTHAITAHGDVEISTDESKYGDRSIKFDGAGDYLTIPQTQNLDFGLDDFTIDYWDYRTVADSKGGICPDYTYSITTGYTSGGTYLLYVSSNSAASWNVISGLNCGPEKLNAWTHLAYVRKNGVMYVYIDGELRNSAACNSVIYGVGNLGWNIGRWDTNLNGNYAYHNGYKQNIRIVNGHALWSQDFELTNDALFYNNQVNEFTQTSEIVTLPADIRQLGAGVDLNTDEKVKNTRINTWKVE